MTKGLLDGLADSLLRAGPMKFPVIKVSPELWSQLKQLPMVDTFRGAEVPTESTPAYFMGTRVMVDYNLPPNCWEIKNDE